MQYRNFKALDTVAIMPFLDIQGFPLIQSLQINVVENGQESSYYFELTDKIYKDVYKWRIENLTKIKQSVFIKKDMFGSCFRLSERYSIPYILMAEPNELKIAELGKKRYEDFGGFEVHELIIFKEYRPTMYAIESRDTYYGQTLAISASSLRVANQKTKRDYDFMFSLIEKI